MAAAGDAASRVRHWHHLPEAQLDRFMFELRIGYPTVEEEEAIVTTTTGILDNEIKPVISAEMLRELMRLVRRIPVPPSLLTYAVGLARATRPHGAGASDMVKRYISFGAAQRLVAASPCSMRSASTRSASA